MREAGRFPAALDLLGPALRARPDDPALLTELGLVHLWMGQPGEALAPLQRALARAPDDYRHHYNMGCALEQLGRAAEAIAAFSRAAELNPASPDAREKLGNLLVAHGRENEATTHFRRAAQAAPATTLGRMCHAKVLIAEGQPAAAEACLRDAIASDPQAAEAQRFLGTLLREQGRFPEAIATLEASIEAEPVRAPAYYDLVQSKRITEADRWMIERMEGLLTLPGLIDPWRIMLHFGLGKALDDLGDYGAAMRHFETGNRLARARMQFDRAQLGAATNRVIATFTAEFFAEHAGLGSQDDTPVLILGMPRSGTTLTEQILSRHPRVGAGGELGFWRERAETFAKAGAAGLAPDFVGGMASDYLALLHGLAPGAARVTDKMPANFLWLGLIHLAFPRARIIHCRRHPVDIALSNYFTHFQAPLAFAYDREDLVYYYRCYERLMAHWRRVLPPDRLLELDYETMVTDREPTTRRLIAFCGLDWDDACLRPEDSTRVVRTASMWQARQTPYTTSVARWRRYEKWLGPLALLLEHDAPLPQPRRGPDAIMALRQVAVHRAAGRYAPAVAALRQAAELCPNDARVENEAGLIFLAQHDFPRAVDFFERAIALDPGYAVAHYNLACAFERQRRPVAAVAAYERAIALAPDFAEAQGRLGNLLHAQGRRAEALEWFRRLSAAAPDSSAGRFARAKLLLEEGRTHEAEAVLRRIVAAAPASGEAWRLLGGCLAESGRFAEAGRCLERALAEDPTQVAAWLDLMRSRRITAADRPLLERIDARLRGPDLTDAERAVLHFAAGKGHDDLGEYAAAIGHFDIGNQLEKFGVGFDRAAFAASIDRIIDLFGPERFAAGPVPNSDRSDLPALILGLPRSGTTLVEQILSSHAQVGAGGELAFWSERAAGLDPADPAALRAAARAYLALLRAIAPPALRVTDKMPFNFLNAGLIHLALPGGRLIHCRRDPVDTCLSIYQTRFAIRHEWTYARGDLVFYYRQYERLMAHWRAVLPADRFLEVDYETLVAEPEAAARRLIDFIGLPWDPACLRPEDNSRVIRTASMWQARQKIHTGAIERWRNYDPWLGELRGLLPS